MTTDTRIPLSRDRVIEAAVALADEHGLDGISMRKLGAELGVEAMSLYNHVDDKGDLFDGMIDHVFISIQIPDGELSWQDQTRLIGQGAMDRFSAHPWVASLLMQRGNFGPAALAFMDHVVGILFAAGFNEEDVHHAWQMLASHTIGYAFQSSGGAGVQEKDFISFEDDLPRIAAEFPYVARLAPFLIECSWDTEYMFGLEIIIDGLESRLG
jgi:AcrR family transcriptional regulator